MPQGRNPGLQVALIGQLNPVGTLGLPSQRPPPGKVLTDFGDDVLNRFPRQGVRDKNRVMVNFDHPVAFVGQIRYGPRAVFVLVDR